MRPRIISTQCRKLDVDRQSQSLIRLARRIGIGVEWSAVNCNESTRQPRPVRMNQPLSSFAMPASGSSIS